MKKFLIFFIITVYSFNCYAVDAVSVDEIVAQKRETYAYIRVEGKFLSKRLKVKVDLGDSENQIAAGEKLSDLLSSKKSYAAVLNYMSDLGYELINTLELTNDSSASRGISVIVYVMKKVE